MIISLCIILSLSTNFNSNTQVYSISDTVETTGEELDYIISSPILIDEESDFTSLGFSGSGTNGDPYLITNLKIETTGGYAIRVTSVTSAFTIRDCYFKANQYAVDINGPMTNKIIIENNTVVNSDNGLYLRYLDDLEIINNTFQNCGFASIRVSFTDGVKIINNTITGSERVDISASESATIVNNTCTNTGFIINANEAWYSNFEVENNMVNGKPLLFLANPQDIVISDNIYGQIIVGDGNNVTVKDQFIENTATPIYLNAVRGMHVHNCTCLYNHVSGIDVRGWDAVVEDCEVEGNEDYGIDVSTVINAEVSNCYVHHNNAGIYALGADNSVFFNNSIEYNLGQGLRLQSNSVVDVLNNTFTHNLDSIWSYNLENCTIAYNLFDYAPTGNYAIFLYFDCIYNIIHNNFFVNNNVGGGTQVYDDGSNNLWYNPYTLIGNYYSDYSGTGPYNIEGSAGASDPYVIIDSTAPSVAAKSSDLEYTEEATGNTIYWQPFDQYPRFYQLLLDDSYIRVSYWRSYDIIIINVDGLDIGEHNYTAVFFDMAGNKFASTILVTVNPVVPEFQSSNIIVLSLTIISIISVSSILVKRKN